MQNCTTKWITCPSPKPEALIRLFCFHYAGGSANVFRDWPTHLPAFEICMVQLPGRDNRFNEEFEDNSRKCVQQFCNETKGWLSKPAVFFGYSMGATLCFEIAREYRRRAQPLPLQLILAAAPAPHLPKKSRMDLKGTREECIETIKIFNGTPPWILENEELMNLIWPRLRADFKLDSEYVFIDERPLDCPFILLGGKHDPFVSHADLAAWGNHSKSKVELQLFEGDHFFLHQQLEDVLSCINLHNENLL